MPETSYIIRARPAIAVAIAFAVPAAAQQPPAPSAPAAAAEAGAPPYADMAELTLASPVIADATVRSAARIEPGEAPGLAAGKARFYVQADVASLVRAPAALPPRLGYLVDVPLDARGRAPKLKNRRVLIFARPVPGRSDQLQLAAPDAQVDWTPAADARARRIAREVIAAEAPPAVTGVGNAFHVPGALPGEGETQVFLRTADNKPVSITVLRRPGERKRWAVALSEIVDEAAGPPARDTLLWYRLACGLPPVLPAAALDQLAPEDAAKAGEDYAFVLTELGPCGRTRGPVTTAR